MNRLTYGPGYKKASSIWAGRSGRRVMERSGRRRSERRAIWKKGDGNGVTWKKEKREAEEKIFRCIEGVYGGVGAREKDIGNRMLWSSIICCGNPLLKGKTERRLLVCILEITSNKKLVFLQTFAFQHGVCTFSMGHATAASQQQSDKMIFGSKVLKKK